MEQYPDLDRVLFTEEEIRNRVKELGTSITQDYACLLYTSCFVVVLAESLGIL